MENRIDPRLGLHPQAWAIVHLLAEHDFDLKKIEGRGTPLWDVQSSAFYNGRERGICISTWLWGERDKKQLNVFFAECRNSDEILVLMWDGDGPGINPPVVSDVPQEAWETNKRFFKYSETALAAIHIRKLIQHHIEVNTPEVEL